MNTDKYPSALALEYAHDVRWPNDRIDLARLCEQYVRERDDEIARLCTAPGAALAAEARASAIVEARALTAKPGSDT